MHSLMNEHELFINVNKTVVMIFNNKVSRINKQVKLFFNDSVLEVVTDFKYLGCYLTPNLCENLDMDRCNLSFKRSFGFLFRKFYSISVDVFYSLFTSYCTSFYASELWVDKKKCSRNFKNLSISYHLTLKKIIGFPKFHSNHFTCSIFNAMTFEHFSNFKCIKFIFWLLNNNGPCFRTHKFYFLKNSIFKRRLDDICTSTYGIVNLFDNDMDAILARIYYVQEREPSSRLLL